VPTLTFLGAAGTVTGSRYLIETASSRVLVDCGMFQGRREERRRNWAPFPVDPATIDAVVLTHAHIDHSGWLPRLVDEGFSGLIHCTPGTADLLNLLLPDAAHLQEEEARYANKKGSSRHSPALPLFTARDARRALDAVAPLDFHRAHLVAPGCEVTFRRAGHILGAASVLMRLDDDGAQCRVFFSGDVGRPNDDVMVAPDPVPATEYLLTESTYGDRVHEEIDVEATLADIVERTIARGGSVLIPVFAIGRAQTVLHALGNLRDAGRIPRVPIVLNSPMAIDATELYQRHRDDHRLSTEQCARMWRDVEYTRSVEESIALTQRNEPMIVLSASGMATGGRVLHHLIHLADDARNSIVFVGYQAVGTRGHALTTGAETVRVYGQAIPLRAEVIHLNALSAHADRDELLAWLASCPQPPHRTWVVHGEPDAAAAFADALSSRHGWNVRIPEFGDTVTL
jgi:metallo-beta-lactamase family protein